MKGEVKTINGKRVSSTEYMSWQMMKNRCLNPRATDWKYYGGRGIKVCARWIQFDNFIEDMGRKSDRNLTLERRNSNGHYSKSNCYWATRSAQAQNRDYCKLSKVQAALIRRLYATNLYRQIDLAKMFKVSQLTISHVVRNKTWREEKA